MPPLLLPGLEPATPGTPTVLTRVRCLSLKPDMDREVRSHPDSRISAKVQSWELGLSRVLRPAYITDCATSPVNDNFPKNFEHFHNNLIFYMLKFRYYKSRFQ